MLRKLQGMFQQTILPLHNFEGMEKTEKKNCQGYRDELKKCQRRA
jgi:hypothetical protein